MINQFDELYENKDILTNEKEKFTLKIVDNSIDKIKLEFLNKELNQKEEEKNQLKKVILFYKEEILDRLEEKPDSNMLQQWKVPLLPSILIILFEFVKSKSGKSENDLKSLISKLEELLKGIDLNKREEIIDIITSMFQNNKK